MSGFDDSPFGDSSLDNPFAVSGKTSTDAPSFTLFYPQRILSLQYNYFLSTIVSNSLDIFQESYHMWFSFGACYWFKKKGKCYIFSFFFRIVSIPNRLLLCNSHFLSYLSLRNCPSIRYNSLPLPYALNGLLVQDPAIQQVTRTTRNAESSLEDYNPFEHEQSKSAHAKLHSGYNSVMGVGVGAAIVQPKLENIVPGGTQARPSTMIGGNISPLPSTGGSASQLGSQNTTINITTAELQVNGSGVKYYVTIEVK